MMTYKVRERARERAECANAGSEGEARDEETSAKKGSLVYLAAAAGVVAGGAVAAGVAAVGVVCGGIAAMMFEKCSLFFPISNRHVSLISSLSCA